MSFADHVVNSALQDYLWPRARDIISTTQSYGRRTAPGEKVARSCISCCRAIGDARKTSKRWVFETDIKSFFTSIDRDVVKRLASPFFEDGELFSLFERACLSDVSPCLDQTADMADKYWPTGVGIVQGGAVSPLLANLVLADADRGIGDKYRFYRYVDDVLLVADSRDAATAGAAIVAEQISNCGAACYELEEESDKSGLRGPDESLDFLGLSVTPVGEVLASQCAFDTFWHHIRDIIRKERGLGEVLYRLESFLAGWFEYYRDTDIGSQQLRNIDGRIAGHLSTYLEQNGLSLSSKQRAQFRKLMSVSSLAQLKMKARPRRRKQRLPYEEPEFHQYDPADIAAAATSP
jgi:hypothetical protein